MNGQVVREKQALRKISMNKMANYAMSKKLRWDFFYFSLFCERCSEDRSTSLAAATNTVAFPMSFHFFDRVAASLCCGTWTKS